MSCDTCQEHLLDLLYEEVEGEEADALRAHVDGCEECRASFEKLGLAQRLATELPLLDAPAPATSAILQAARAHVGAATPAAELEARAEPDEEEGVWARFLRWAGSFAMGPQVAMATIMLLVVSIGLWYFPNRPRGPEGTGSTVMTPDDQGEVGPSAMLSPADPLELDLDERTGRIRTRADGEERLARQVERPATAAPVPARDEEASAADGDDSVGRVVDGRLADNAARGFEQQLEGRGEHDLDALANLGASGGAASSGSGSVRSESLAEQQQAAPPSAPRQRSTRPAPSTTTATPEAEEANRQQPGAAPAEPPPATAREAYARGMQRYQRGNFWGAAEDFDRVYRNPDGQTSLVPSALHHMARSHRRANSCRTAVTHYRSLLARFPSYSGTPRAMIELADCYRQLGRISDARATLEQAQRHASVAAEARRELLRIREMERAARRMDRMEADEAAAEAAY